MTRYSRVPAKSDADDALVCLHLDKDDFAPEYSQFK